MAEPDNHPAKETTQTQPATTATPEQVSKSPLESTTSTLPTSTKSSIPRKAINNDTKTPSQIDTKSTSSISRPSYEKERENAATQDCKLEQLPDFDTNNNAPSAETISKIGDFTVLDKDGKSVPFKNVYSGPNVVRRVLVVFIRHFFCSSCQEYVRQLSSNKSLTPNALLSLPIPTFICIIGCGSPGLISHYVAQTNCPYPIYADPTKQLYNELKMVRTWGGGKKQPEYIGKSFLNLVANSAVQIVKQVGKGNALKHGQWNGGDFGQVGGEFLFEPLHAADHSPGGFSPSETPESDMSTPRIDGKGEDYLSAGEKRKDERVVTWCHRMRNTRDHTEVKDLLKVLGIGKVEVERKLTGMSARSRAESTKENEKQDTSLQEKVIVE